MRFESYVLNTSLKNTMERIVSPDKRAIEIYLKCNSMRNIWNELHRRGLPDPHFPEPDLLETKDKLLEMFRAKHGM